MFDFVIFLFVFFYKASTGGICPETLKCFLLNVRQVEVLESKGG